jgi:glycogen synthase
MYWLCLRKALKIQRVMKVLMLGWELPPHNSGGLGVACYQLCKALTKKVKKIDFVVPYTAKHNIGFMDVTSAVPTDVVDVQKAGIAYDSYKYVYSDGSVEWADIFSQQQHYEYAVGEIVKKKHFDVIHAHDWLTFKAGVKARDISGKPLIAHVHSIERDRAGGNEGNPLVREIEYLAMMSADEIIAVSELTKQAIIADYKIPAGKIQVVHNSIDRDDIESADNDNVYRYLDVMKQNGYKVVVNIGRITVQKGLPNLLRAAKNVIDEHPKTIFLIVGSGEQERELIELSAMLGISKNVIFAGFQRGKKWRDAYAIGDLFVMPSVSEPFGLTPIEAIAYGTPSLISKQSGVAEVLYNCLKINYWDIDEMANQITGVVQNNALRDELITNAYKEFENMSWEKAASAIMGAYNKHTKLRVIR